MKLRIRRNIESVFYFLLVSMPFVDMLTGYFINTGKYGFFSQVGQLYRVILFSFLIYYAYFSAGKVRNIWALFFLAYTMILPIYYFFMSGDTTGIIEDYAYVIKVTIPIHMIYMVMGMEKRSRLSSDFVDKVMDFYKWIYPLSILLPWIFRTGFYHYYGNGGYKGFYYANNDVNIILIVCFVGVVDDFMNKKKKYAVIHLIIVMLAVALMGSKTSIISMPVVFICFLFQNADVKKMLKRMVICLTGMVVVVTIFTKLLSKQFGVIVERLIYAYHMYERQNLGWQTFLLSERNLRIEPAIEGWYVDNSNGILNFFLGVGKYQKCPDNSNIWGNMYSLIEMDCFDILFWFGIIVLVVVLVIYGKSYICAGKSKNMYAYKIMFLFMIGFSFFAGHVMTVPSAGAILGLVCAKLRSGKA